MSNLCLCLSPVHSQAPSEGVGGLSDAPLHTLPRPMSMLMDAGPQCKTPSEGTRTQGRRAGRAQRGCWEENTPQETPGDSPVPECTPRAAPTTPHHLALVTGPALLPCSVWCWLAARCWRRWPRWRPRPVRWWSHYRGDGRPSGHRQGLARTSGWTGPHGTRAGTSQQHHTALAAGPRSALRSESCLPAGFSETSPEGAGPGIPAARKTVHTLFLNGRGENHTLVSKMCTYYYKGVTFCSDY